MNEAHHREWLDPRLDARFESFELAFRMQTEAAEAFDISREPQHVRDLYGSGVHGRQTLIARRLVERGVRFGSGTARDSRGTTTKRSRKVIANLPANWISRSPRCSAISSSGG